MSEIVPKQLVPDASEVYAPPYSQLPARLTDEQKTQFLELVQLGDSQPRAAYKLGTTMTVVNREAAADEQFLEDLKRALNARASALEEKAIEFALRGTEEDVYYLGAPVGTKVNYGPHGLLQFLLKGNMREKYGTERTEQNLTLQHGAPPSVRNDEDAQKLLAKMQAELRPVIDGVFVELPPTSDDDIEDLL